MHPNHYFKIRYLLLFVAWMFIAVRDVSAQYTPEMIFSKAVLYKERVKLNDFLYDNVIKSTLVLPLDSTTEYRYEGACNTIAQYLVGNIDALMMMDRLFESYETLQYDTRRAVLEAAYAVSPYRYTKRIRAIVLKEANSKIFAMNLVYLFRADTTNVSRNEVKKMAGQWSAKHDDKISLELSYYLINHQKQTKQKTPSLTELFNHQKNRKRKIIYSFQRWDRNYPGLAIVQLPDGSFARHADGKLMVFEQLARSASDLPYFITNGSTPQGVYCITGTAISKSSIIGPSPNLQLLMPYEGKWNEYFYDADSLAIDTTEAGIQSTYAGYFPIGWRHYEPMSEVMTAGRIGRTEIIAHGTTIDPGYFTGKPFYPLTPTMGCLCAREQWNITTGKPVFSEQLNLINAWLSSEGQKGLLYVINLDDKKAPVSRKEIEELIKAADHAK